MTLLLVMLHTGTMFAVIVYFWSQWRRTYFRSVAALREVAVLVVVATLLTGVVGLGIKKLLEITLLSALPHGEIEDMFGHLEFIAPALVAAGLLILAAGLLEKRYRPRISSETTNPTLGQAALIGAVQGLCLPFRGFSRSGATISAGMLAGVTKARAEAFSFALAVAPTPAHRTARSDATRRDGGAPGRAARSLWPGVGPHELSGAVIAFFCGPGRARLGLSRWLEAGRWYQLRSSIAWPQRSCGSATCTSQVTDAVSHPSGRIIRVAALERALERREMQ